MTDKYLRELVGLGRNPEIKGLSPPVKYLARFEIRQDIAAVVVDWRPRGRKVDGVICHDDSGRCTQRQISVVRRNFPDRRNLHGSTSGHEFRRWCMELPRPACLIRFLCDNLTGSVTYDNTPE